MDAEVFARAENIAQTVARRYARVFHWVEADELEQVAWQVLIEYHDRWAPRTPAGEVDPKRFGGRGYIAAQRQVNRWIWRAASPVTLSDRHATRAGVGTTNRTEDVATLPDRPELTVGDDPQAHRAGRRLRRRVARRIVALCGWGTRTAVALAILVGGEDEREVCARMRLPLRTVRAHVRAVRRQVAGDEALRRMIAGGG